MLDLDDIQGNILAGFNTDFEVMLGLNIDDDKRVQEIANWLTALSPNLTSVSEIQASRSIMKLANYENSLVWLFLAVSERLIGKIQPGIIFSDEAFRRGMPRRAGTLLGDKTPSNEWVIGGTKNQLDVFLIVASNNRETAEKHANLLVNSAESAGLIKNFQETAIKIGGREHFGFKDGVSQPLIVGIDDNAELEPGHFVYGYPKISNGKPVTVHVDTEKITTNGSLLVIRRLEQNVELFRKFCDKETKRIKAIWPDLNSDHLQALLVGRWPNGAMASISDKADPGVTNGENLFDFSDDPNGQTCPFGAHIRKVNPRKGPRDVVDIPRLLRRGIPFGPLYENAPNEKRGLFFLAFQTSIVDAFEFITSKWMNTANRPVQMSGNDLLIGRAVGNRSTILKSPYGPVEVSAEELNWVTPTGGAYMFAPGKKGLAKFNQNLPVSIRNKFRRGITNVKDFLNINF